MLSHGIFFKKVVNVPKKCFHMSVSKLNFLSPSCFILLVLLILKAPFSDLAPQDIVNRFVSGYQPTYLHSNCSDYIDGIHSCNLRLLRFSSQILWSSRLKHTFARFIIFEKQYRFDVIWKVHNSIEVISLSKQPVSVLENAQIQKCKLWFS